jgi:hypothetical protein
MKHRLTFTVALSALVGILVGCTETPLDSQTLVTEPIVPKPDTATRPCDFYNVRPCDYPTIVGPAVIHNRITASYIPGRSRYVLYDNGRFGLQYLRPDWGFFEYPGRYSRADSMFTFDFDGWSSAGPWLANGILRGDSLIVKYNLIMNMTDFEDGVFIRR